MNILLDCERLKYPNTGLYQFCNDFTEALERVVAKDDSLCYYVPDGKKFRGDKAAYYRYRITDKFVKRHVKGIEVFHALQQLSQFRIGDRHTRMVLTVHDLNFLYEKHNDAKIKNYLKKHQRIIDRADAIVAISHYTKNDISTHLNTRGKPVEVIHNGCHIAEFEGYDSPVYRPAGPFILAIGAVVPKKNFHTLPALLTGNDYELVIAGNKSGYVGEIEKEAKRHNVSERVKILGPVSKQDKYWYMKNCTAFGFPSIAEGFGLPPIEAMHFGKPVFLSRFTSLPEIGGESAYYFDCFEPESMQKTFASGMTDYMDNDRSKSIQIHGDSFNWLNAAQQYYNLYKNTVR